jgi:hypothetical protein
MIDTMKREKFDNLYTPIEAVHSLLRHINFNRLNVWECADPGNSKISQGLREVKFNVISTDISTGFDFFKDIPTFDFDMIITNPPFSLKNKWLKKCYEYGKPFALLLPLTTLEGIGRNKLFTRYGISVIVLDKRIDFTGKGANWFNASWFVWNVGSLMYGNSNHIFFEHLG